MDKLKLDTIIILFEFMHPGFSYNVMSHNPEINQCWWFKNEVKQCNLAADKIIARFSTHVNRFYKEKDNG